MRRRDFPMYLPSHRHRKLSRWTNRLTVLAMFAVMTLICDLRWSNTTVLSTDTSVIDGIFRKQGTYSFRYDSHPLAEHETRTIQELRSTIDGKSKGLQAFLHATNEVIRNKCQLKANVRTQMQNGTVLHVPAEENRYHVPWFIPREHYRLNTVRESRNRVIYSPVRLAAGDGLGHAMASMNFEIRVAHLLGLSFSHREAYYSSLSGSNPDAVDEFFGWANGVERRRSELEKYVCDLSGDSEPDGTLRDLQKCHLCKGLQGRNKFGIEHLADIPEDIVTTCLKIGVLNKEQQNLCDKHKHQFLALNSRPNTLFQVPHINCSARRSSSIFGDTKHYYWHKYWGTSKFLSNAAMNLRRKTIRSREIILSENHLSIAVHVRRGDFIEMESVKRSRAVLADDTYAELINKALIAVSQVESIFRHMPIALHIFSEGKLTSRNVLSTHNITFQDKTYYDINGIARDVNWWFQLVERSARNLDCSSKKQEGDCKLCWQRQQDIDDMKNRLRIYLRISEPTLQSLHEMISADIFIGSVSGMSTHIVWALSRGISLIPSGSPVGSEGLLKSGYRERVCCTVSFDRHNFRFNEAMLLQYWDLYAKANEKSAQRALRERRTAIFQKNARARYFWRYRGHVKPL